MKRPFHKYFKILDWQLDTDNYQLLLSYQLETIGKVTETISFPNFDYASILNKTAIDKACELVHLMCAVSYYKSELATEIILKNKNTFISTEMAKFIAKTWKHGLAEMAFENNISLQGLINFQANEITHKPIVLENKKKLNKSLIAIGGGKDSLVTIEELKEQGGELGLFMVGSSNLIKEVARFTKLPLIQIVRKIDPKLIEYNNNGALNGHIPITAINSCIGILSALLFGYDSVVFSNERSADSANTINSDGEKVNHQYSKSYEFEKDLSKIIATEISSDIYYYSQQRRYSELAILKKFCQYPQYFPIFSSCNRNFHIDGSKNQNCKWCCNCPKCRFVFLGLAPFLEKQQLLQIFKGNMLDDTNQLDGFARLLGLQGFKPFECVGEIQESQLAFNMIKNKTDWIDSCVINNFKDTCPPTTDVQYQHIMLPSKVVKLTNTQALAPSILELKNKKIAIWGFGVEGKATAEYLSKHNIDFKILCSKTETAKEYHCITSTVNQDLLESFEYIIKSPGISPYSQLIANADTKFISPTAIWFANENNTKVIAVTGTKGKSTTVSLLAHILKTCKKHINLVGNIGQALISSSSNYDYIILEASSFQIYDGNIKADIAVITNLFAEHIDWHQCKENYFSDKLKLLSQAKIKIANAENPTIEKFINDEFIKDSNIYYFNHSSGFHVVKENLLYKNQIILSLSEINLIGTHNLQNIGAALTVCMRLHMELKPCIEAVKTFKPLAHRLQNLGKYGQHFAINDSIATTPIATLAAMKTINPSKTTLLVGGYDRGNDWSEFAQSLHDNPPNLLIISGHNSENISQYLQSINSNINYHTCKNLKQAIQLAQDKTQINGLILLSPGAPSFDQFDSYIQRGEFFQEELKKNV